MATIIIKHNSTTGNAPSAGDLTEGELALNTADGKLWTKNSGGSVVPILGGDSGKLVLISEAAASTSAAVTFSDKIDSTVYGEYRIVLLDCTPQTDGSTLALDIGATGGGFAASWDYVNHFVQSTTTHSVTGSNAQSTCVLTQAVGNQAGENVSGFIDIYVGSAVTKLNGILSYKNGAGTLSASICYGQTTITGSTVADVQLAWSSGNFNGGTVRLFGRQL